jgi:hypothetical protein
MSNKVGDLFKKAGGAIATKIRSGGQTLVNNAPEIIDNTSAAISGSTDVVGLIDSGAGIVGSGGGTVVDAVAFGLAAKESAADGLNVVVQLKHLKDFKAACKKDPEVAALIRERTNFDVVMQLHKQEAAKCAEKVVSLAARAEEIKKMMDPDSPEHQKLSDAEKAVVPQLAGMLEQLNNEAAQQIQRIQSLNEATKGIDARITEINQEPRMQQLVALEAKADLAKETLKRQGKSVRNAMDTLEKGASTLSSGAQAVLNVLEVTAVGGEILGTAVGVAGPAITIATGTLQAGVGAINLGMDVHAYVKAAEMQTAAHEARADITDPALEAAIKRIELQAKTDKYVKAADGVKHGTAVVTGVATGVAGAGLLAAAAGSAGMGMGAAPGAAIAAAGVAVAVTSAGVTIGVSAGVEVFKYKVNSHNMNTAAEAELALKGINKLRNMVLSGDIPANPVAVDEPEEGPAVAAEAPEEDKELGNAIPAEAEEMQQAPDHAEGAEVQGNQAKLLSKNAEMKPGADSRLLTKKELDAIMKIQQHAIKKGQLDPNNAMDLDNLAKYMEKRIISRDNKQAITVIANKLLDETRQARNHRQGGPIVVSDLPRDGQTVKALRKIGLKDREITGISNAIANKSANKAGIDTLKNKTGLKFKS